MGKPVEKKRKKKGRPSLLDLQKRSLRLQKQQEQELQQQQQEGRKSSSSNPSANPYLRFPASGTPGRPAARRDPPEAELGGEDGEDEEGGGGKRREKKLKLVLRLHQEEDGGGRSGNPQRGRGIGDSSGSESRGEGGTPRKKRKIDVVGGDGSGLDKTERQSFASKATEGEPSDSGPTTPLPDKKLLEFILDRLQKKDTYGVFAEPVDPEELPDYHEIIDHPMDFSTVRKRLSNGYYKNLEMFEKDVFLICSNAMSYNAPDTIYFRQARSIQELAKKNFENLRQDSDDEEPEPKVVRRGRPPGKNTAKKAVGRPADRASTEFAADATLANAGDSAIWSNSSYDLSRKGFASDKLGSMDTLTRSNHRFNTSETSIWMAEKSDRNDDAGAVRGTPMRSGKKVFVLDENRRNTYKQSQASTSWPESSIYTTFDGEKKQLVPQVGLNIEHAYARSLARFAANLGPLGWEIAAKQIEKVLPPGTRFGRGWVGQSDMPQQYQPPLLCTTSQPSSDIRVPSSSVLPKTVVPSEQPNSPLNNATVQVNHPCRSTPASSSSGISSIRPPMSAEPAEPAREVNHDSEFGLVSDNGTAVIGGARPRAQFQLNQNMTYRPGMNGFKVPFGFDMHQAGMMVRPPGPIGSFEQEVPMTHARVLDMVSRGNSSFSHSPQSELEGPKPIYPGIAHHPQGPRSVWRPLSLNPKPESTQPPDLNLRFQSPGSPPSGVAVDSQQPDLALQL